MSQTVDEDSRVRDRFLSRFCFQIKYCVSGSITVPLCDLTHGRATEFKRASMAERILLSVRA